jgi:hypothetical protein
MSYEPTNLDMFVSEVKQTGVSKFTGTYNQVPFRIFTGYFQKVEALRLHMGVSRNKVLNSLIEIALDEVFERLEKDPKTLEAVAQKMAEVGLSYDGSGDLAND